MNFVGVFPVNPHETSLVHLGHQKWFKRLVAYAKCNRDSYESELGFYFYFSFLCFMLLVVVWFQGIEVCSLGKEKTRFSTWSFYHFQEQISGKFSFQFYFSSFLLVYVHKGLSTTQVGKGGVEL